MKSNTLATYYINNQELHLNVTDRALKVINQGRIDTHQLISNVSSVGEDVLTNIRHNEDDAVVYDPEFGYTIVFTYIENTITIQSIISERNIFHKGITELQILD